MISIESLTVFSIIRKNVLLFYLNPTSENFVKNLSSYGGEGKGEEVFLTIIFVFYRISVWQCID